MSGIQMAMLMGGGIRGSILAATNGNIIGYLDFTGSVAPTPFFLFGKEVLGLYDFHNVPATFEVAIDTVGLPVDFFSSIQIANTIKLTSAVDSHVNGPSYTTWVWNLPVGLVSGTTYPFTFT